MRRQDVLRMLRQVGRAFLERNSGVYLSLFRVSERHRMVLEMWTRTYIQEPRAVGFRSRLLSLVPDGKDQWTAVVRFSVQYEAHRPITWEFQWTLTREGDTWAITGVAGLPVKGFRVAPDHLTVILPPEWAEELAPEAEQRGVAWFRADRNPPKWSHHIRVVPTPSSAGEARLVGEQRQQVWSYVLEAGELAIARYALRWFLRHVKARGFRQLQVGWVQVRGRLARRNLPVSEATTEVAASSSSAPPYPLPVENPVIQGPWYGSPDLWRAASRVTGTVREGLARRAALRLARYLEADGRISSAAFMANLMSTFAARLAYAVRGPSLRATLENAWNLVRDQVRAGVAPSQRGNNVSEAYYAQPVMTVDELFGSRPECGTAYGICHSVSSLTLALLRLNGLPPTAGFKTATDLHETGLVETEGHFYVLNNESVVEVFPDGLFWNRNLRQVYNDHYYLMADGDSNLGQEQVAQLRAFFDRIPFFSVPGLVAWRQPERPRIDQQAEDTVSEEITPEELAERRFLQALDRAASGRDPVTELALYAFQTLLVPCPWVYAAVSAEHDRVVQLAKELGSPEQAIAWINQLDPNGLYPEPHRIMLADQVIRYRRADVRSRALMLLSLLENMGLKAEVHLAGRQAYTVWHDPTDGLQVWDATSGALSETPPPVAELVFTRTMSTIGRVPVC
jgi:hypothetical protein